MITKKEIIIWGAGNQGRAAYYTLKKKCDILGFYDSASSKIGEEIIDRKKVLNYEDNNVFIIIACEKWMEVVKTLQQKGKKLIKDFLPYHMFMRKQLRLEVLLDFFQPDIVTEYLYEIKKRKQIAFIYGNCQTEILANMMEYNKEFNERYILLRVPPIHLFRDEDQISQIFYKNGIMQLVDLFIFQKVKLGNRFNPLLSTEQILTQVHKHCRKMPIHNIYFDGYFIQYNGDKNRYFNNMNQQDFPYADSIVESCIQNGRNADEVLALLHNEDFIESEKIIGRCKDSLNRLRKREIGVEIPIVDYIEENYCKEQLFYTCNHPKNIVLYEYVKRILRTIGIEQIERFTEEELYLEFGNLRVNNFPILPCVIKALGLKKYETKMRISHISSGLITMDEYLKEYMSRCCGI